jgi:membrane-anchored protein YejM (alkaline phosphatase superfamily)
MTRSVRAWFAARADAYVVLVAALGLNLPALAVALAHHLEGVTLMSPAGAYAALVIVGYYGFVLLVLLTVLFAFVGFSRRLTALTGGTLLFGALSYLVTNSVVYRTFRYHVDAFWLRYVMTSYSGMGVTPQMAAMLVAVLLGIGIFEWWVVRLAGALAARRRLALATVAIILISFVAGQLMHVVGYYRSDSRITSITPQLPFYSPIVSQKHAAHYDELVTMGLEPEDPKQATSNASLRYPLREVRCTTGGPRPNILLLLLESWRYDMMDSTVTPNIHALSLRSSVFLRHLSSGNSTPSGVFGLFYGIHPTYWSAVKANNAVIDNPVLIDVLGKSHYAFGIYADSQFGRHKIKDAMFRGITVHETFAGGSPDAKDDDMTNQLIGFVDREHRAGRPFFGFAFYKSSHYSYRYPSSAARFQPTKELNVALDQNAADVTPFMNDCRNSVYYTDSLIGRIIAHLDSAGLMNETIVIVTSDHGEEFNDNHAGWWGHTGNFTRYQVQVPLVLYWPGKRPRQVSAMTTHMDVPTTLLSEVFGCGSARDYSNGVDLFALPAEPRPFVVGSYVNHAFIMGDDVHVVYPMFVQSYKLGDIKARAGAPPAALARRLLEETHRFYQSGGAPGIASRVPLRDIPDLARHSRGGGRP